MTIAIALYNISYRFTYVS